MAYEITVTVMGAVDDRSAALRLADDIRVLALRAGTLGCVAQVRDLRRGEDVHYTVLHPRSAEASPRRDLPMVRRSPFP